MGADGGGRRGVMGQLLPYLDKMPKVAPDAFIAPGAILVGDVEVGPGASIWYNCVLRGDVNYIRVGEGSNIQDGSVIHVDRIYPTIIGKHCLIGHLAIVHGVTMEDGSFVGMKGGYVYPERVLASEKKPLRIFMADGRNDHRGKLGDRPYDPQLDWFYQNVRLEKALSQKGYDVNYSWSVGLHGWKFGGMILPDVMRWLWRDGPVSTDPNDMDHRGFRQPGVGE